MSPAPNPVLDHLSAVSDAASSLALVAGASVCLGAFAVALLLGAIFAAPFMPWSRHLTAPQDRPEGPSATTREPGSDAHVAHHLNPPATLGVQQL